MTNDLAVGANTGSLSVKNDSAVVVKDPAANTIRESAALRFVDERSPGVLISFRDTTKQERALPSACLEHALPRLLIKELSLLSTRNEIKNRAVVIPKRY